MKCLHQVNVKSLYHLCLREYKALMYIYDSVLSHQHIVLLHRIDHQFVVHCSKYYFE